MNGVEIRQNGETTICAATSELGAIAVAVRGGTVADVRFGFRTCAAAVAAIGQPAARSSSTAAPAADAEVDAALADEVLEQLVRYAAGEPVDLADIPTAVDHLSPFQRRVVRACRAIPRGERRTYGQLAAVAGSPGAARAVGAVMASNRVPLVVPCHRVVGAGGSLGGFSAPTGLRMKRRLLELESTALIA